MYSQVRFRNHRNTPPLLIPGDALIVSSAGLQIATLVDAPDQNRGDSKTKKIHLNPVQVGRDYGAETEILSGAHDGQLVVVNPGDEVKEGALVHYDLSGGTRGTTARGKPNPTTTGGNGPEPPAAQRRPGAARQ